MSVFDEMDSDIPPPPPRDRTKVVKDEPLKDENMYEVQFFDTVKNLWRYGD